MTGLYADVSNGKIIEQPRYIECLMLHIALVSQLIQKLIIKQNRHKMRSKQQNKLRIEIRLNFI